MGTSAAFSFVPFLLCGVCACAMARTMPKPDRGAMLSFGSMMTELGLAAIGIWLAVCTVMSVDHHRVAAGRLFFALLIMLVAAVVIWLRTAWKGREDDDGGLGGGEEPDPDPPPPEPHYAMPWDDFDAWREGALWASFDSQREGWEPAPVHTRD